MFSGIHKSMNWYTTTTTVQPATEPVTTEELHEHLFLNVALDAVSTLLTLYIAAARQQYEQDTGRTLITQTLKQSQSRWEYPTRLFRAPVQSITDVKYYDQDDELQTLDNWGVDLSGTPALIYRTDGTAFPALSTRRPRPIEITYVAGGTPEAVEPIAKLAIMLLAGHYYNQREAYGEANLNSVPRGWDAITTSNGTGLGAI